MTTLDGDALDQYNRKHAKWREELNSLCWSAVCQLETGNVEKAKKTAEAAIKVHEAMIADTHHVFGAG